MIRNKTTILYTVALALVTALSAQASEKVTTGAASAFGVDKVVDPILASGTWGRSDYRHPPKRFGHRKSYRGYKLHRDKKRFPVENNNGNSHARDFHRHGDFGHSHPYTRVHRH